MSAGLCGFTVCGTASGARVGQVSAVESPVVENMVQNHRCDVIKCPCTHVCCFSRRVAELYRCLKWRLTMHVMSWCNPCLRRSACCTCRWLHESGMVWYIFRCRPQLARKKNWCGLISTCTIFNELVTAIWFAAVPTLLNLFLYPCCFLVYKHL